MSRWVIHKAGGRGHGPEPRLIHIGGRFGDNPEKLPQSVHRSTRCLAGLWVGYSTYPAAYGYCDLI